MPSTFTWLDYSEADRRRALDVVDLFKETGTLDELGVGRIRDGLADLLFPGTSTIQTRARYFVLVPWLYLDLEERKVPVAKVGEVAARAEHLLNDSVRLSDDSDGNFGERTGHNLKRLASSVYWAGLGNWGIRLYPGSQRDYFRSMDRFLERRRAWKAKTKGEEEQGAAPTNWHAGLPAAPADFPKSASLRLRREDAIYILDRIVERHPETLMGWLANHGSAHLMELEEPWQLLGWFGLPSGIAATLVQARRFAHLIHSASLLYNLMLAEARANLPERVEEYRGGLARWASETFAEQDEIRAWDLAELWGVLQRAEVRVSAPTRLFVSRWHAILRELPEWRGLAESAGARALIRDREYALKRNRARLHNPRHLELWGGSSGAAALTYRWPHTCRILGDVLRAIGDPDAGD